jgi:hypothetical protein
LRVRILAGKDFELGGLSTESLLIRCPFQYAPADTERNPRCQVSLIAERY